MQVSCLVFLDLNLALHLFCISVGALEAHLLREGGAGRRKALFGFAHLCSSRYASSSGIRLRLSAS